MCDWSDNSCINTAYRGNVMHCSVPVLKIASRRASWTVKIYKQSTFNKIFLLIIKEILFFQSAQHRYTPSTYLRNGPVTLTWKVETNSEMVPTCSLHEFRNGAICSLHHRDLSTELWTIWGVLRFRADLQRVWSISIQEIFLHSTDEFSRRYFSKDSGVYRIMKKKKLSDFGEVFAWGFTTGTLPKRYKWIPPHHCTCF